MLAISPSLLDVQLVETGIGQELATLDTESQFPLCFSPDGGVSVTGEGAPTSATVHLWNLRLIRQQLAAMSLDWDAPALPPPDY